MRERTREEKEAPSVLLSRLPDGRLQPNPTGDLWAACRTHFRVTLTEGQGR